MEKSNYKQKQRPMDNIKSFLETLLLPLGLGVFGGIARVCKTGFQTWRQFFSSVTVSAFTGIVVHLAIQDSSFSATMQAAVVAASGYSGGAILDGFIERVTANIRLRRESENSVVWDGVERRKGGKHDG